jgi:hypothetical protein
LVLGTHSLFSLLQSAGCNPQKPNDSANTTEQRGSSTVKGVFAEAFGFVTSEQLESSTVTSVLAEVPGIDADTTSEGNWGSEDEGSYVEDDDSDVEPFIEIYPEAKLVYFKLKNPSSVVKQKLDALRDMNSADNAFKNKLHYSKVLKKIYILIYTCEICPKTLTSDAAKKILQEIENALVHRSLFAVRQRRFVTYLENEGLLLNSAMAWEEATLELKETSNMLWIWHTQRIKPLSYASLRELNSGIEDIDFYSGLRSVFTQELNRKLFWTWLSEKSIVSRCSANVNAAAESASESDDEETEEEEEEEV